MFRYLLVLAVCVCISTSCGSNAAFVADNSVRSVSSVDATSAWNQVCAQYHFIPKPADTRITFLMGYYGTDFTTDFARIKETVNAIMNVQQPTTGSDVMNVQQPTTGSDVMNVQQPTTGSDVMKTKIESWR